MSHQGIDSDAIAVKNSEVNQFAYINMTAISTLHELKMNFKKYKICCTASQNLLFPKHSCLFKFK